MFEIDNQIIKELKKDDKKALKKLYDLFYADLCRYSLKFVNNEHDAEEIVQEVLINIWERRASLKVHSLKNYLFTAAKFRSISFLKNRIKKQNLLEEIPENLFIKADEILENISYKELTQIVQNAIENLPEKCRIVYSLSRNSELTYNEIAKELNISVKTVENHMAAALKKIRKYLKENW